MNSGRRLYCLLKRKVRWRQVQHYDLKINKMLGRGKTMYDPKVIKVYYKLEKYKEKITFYSRILKQN